MRRTVTLDFRVFTFRVYCSVDPYPSPAIYFRYLFVTPQYLLRKRAEVMSLILNLLPGTYRYIVYCV